MQNTDDDNWSELKPEVEYNYGGHFLETGSSNISVDELRGASHT